MFKLCDDISIEGGLQVKANCLNVDDVIGYLK